MSYVDEIRNKTDRRNFLIGRIEEANFWIDYHAKQKSKYAKARLKECKRLRDKDMAELKELG